MIFLSKIKIFIYIISYNVNQFKVITKFGKCFLLALQKGDVLEYAYEYLTGQFAMGIFIIKDKIKQKKAHIGLMKMNRFHF